MALVQPLKGNGGEETSGKGWKPGLDPGWPQPPERHGMLSPAHGWFCLQFRPFPPAQQHGNPGKPLSSWQTRIGVLPLRAVLPNPETVPSPRITVFTAPHGLTAFDTSPLLYYFLGRKWTFSPGNYRQPRTSFKNSPAQCLVPNTLHLGVGGGFTLPEDLGRLISK